MVDFIVNDENGGILDLFKLLVFRDGSKFVESGVSSSVCSISPLGQPLTPEEAWVAFVSATIRKIIRLFEIPLKWFGVVVEFILNLLYLNGGNFFGFIWRIVSGNVEIPDRDSEKFRTAIGHLDGRQELFKSVKGGWKVEILDRCLMDLCIMSSKLAYENPNAITNVVQNQWKMHFVEFIDGWNDNHQKRSTQAFIMCDKAEDAKLIVVCFRGTKLFNADDWCTDFDCSLCDFYKLGKVHTGFLEALGLGNRDKIGSFQMHLLANIHDHDHHPYPHPDPKWEETAYYTVRRRVRELLKQHENAKFVVTGHSLGGALAILFPTVLLLHEEEEMMQRLLGIYTFGQPRVGNQKLASYVETGLDRFHTRYFRLVYCNDLVPRLPYDDQTFLYKHFGNCLYYNSLYSENEVYEEPNKNYFGLLHWIPRYANSVWELLRTLTMEYACGPDYGESWGSFLVRFVGLAMPGVSAHCPLNYVNSVRLGRQLTPWLVIPLPLPACMK